MVPVWFMEANSHLLHLACVSFNSGSYKEGAIDVKLAGKFLIVVFMFSLTGCLWWNGPSGPGTPEALYMRGQEAYQEGDYKDAVGIFQRLTEQYPLSKYAIPAELAWRIHISVMMIISPRRQITATSWSFIQPARIFHM